MKIVCWEHVPNECSHGEPDLHCAQRPVDNVTSFDNATASAVEAAAVDSPAPTQTAICQSGEDPGSRPPCHPSPSLALYLTHIYIPFGSTQPRRIKSLTPIIHFDF